MDLEGLTRFIPAIERALRADYAGERRRENATFFTDLDALDEFALRGGKRLRALLLLAGYRMASRREPTAAIPAAAALEHFQSWMLIHDDIIDHADSRRGGPSLHRALESRARAAGALGDPAALGAGLAITLGDLEVPFTLHGLLAVKAPPARRLRAVEEFVRMTRLTAYGQVLDIRNGSRPVGEIRAEDVLLVHRLKTAYYTAACPLRLGAILGGAGDLLVEGLERFGLDVGVAFQLRDDLFGAGFDDGAGRKSANDLLEGKRTLLVVDAWAAGSPEGRASLEAVLGQPNAPPEAVERARRYLADSGAVAASERRIAELRRRAVGWVTRRSGLRAADRELLVEIAGRLVDRRF